MKNLIMALTLAIALLSGAGGSALASPSEPNHPNEQASCVGLIVSDHARGIPDGVHVREIIEGVKAYAEATGSTPGGFVSSVAHEHLGSHAICGGE